MATVAPEDVVRPVYKSKRCVNCARGSWPGKTARGDVWPDTVNCPLLAPSMASYNYVCKDHVWRDDTKD